MWAKRKQNNRFFFDDDVDMEDGAPPAPKPAVDAQPNPPMKEVRFTSPVFVSSPINASPLPHRPPPLPLYSTPSSPPQNLTTQDGNQPANKFVFDLLT
eukprot:TRINITY_DN48154_c0_g1_i1.p1 TRINITY_DN48154_c0_g1~~TRINITY_DN48154_c0_g1_i1.p1  ORF type:complete len:111 (+),score=19.67 TRINITY_DN48154_c0_g1_i1:42-335(+)